MWVGFAIMVFSVIWASLSFCIDYVFRSEFSWFSESGAVMVSGSILFERMLPGTGLGGGMDIGSLPTLGQKTKRPDALLMKHSGKLSIFVLLSGTLIWAYEPFIIRVILT